MADKGQPSATQLQPSSSAANAAERPYVPTLAVTSPSNYGNIDAENESNLHILSSVESPKASRERPLKSPSEQVGGNPRKRARSSVENSMTGRCYSDEKRPHFSRSWLMQQ